VRGRPSNLPIPVLPPPPGWTTPPLRELLKRWAWQDQRTLAMMDWEERCAGCGARAQRLTVREVWAYAPTEGVRWLVDLRPICGTCAGWLFPSVEDLTFFLDCDPAFLRRYAFLYGVPVEELRHVAWRALGAWRRHAQRRWRSDRGRYAVWLTAWSVQRRHLGLVTSRVPGLPAPAARAVP
jgi:hypothetical protein